MIGGCFTSSLIKLCIKKIFLAVLKNHVKIVKILVRRNLNTDLQNIRGKTALMIGRIIYNINFEQ
jgi:hypothetical protein